MKKGIFLITLILLPLFCSFSAEYPVFKQLRGKVEIKTDITGIGSRWIKAVEGMKIEPGTLISTGFSSSAAIDLDNSEVYVKQLTRVRIENIEKTKNTVKTKLNLSLGRIRADVKASKKLKHDFKIITPVSTAAVRGTKFTAGIGKLKVDSGKIFFTNKIGQGRTIAGGNSSSVGGNGYGPPEGEKENKGNNFNVPTETQPEPDTGVESIIPESSYFGSIMATLNFIILDD
jgi:hypothetical protein